MIVLMLLMATIALVWAFFVCKTFKVVKVLDGDTIVVSRFGFENKVRFWLIDAPESDQLFGIEATEFLKSKILNKNVFLKVEGRSYERMVAKVIRPIWGDVAIPMLKKGLAHVDERFITDTNNEKKKRDMDLYMSLYREAIDKRKGLFGYPYILPRLWREHTWKIETPIERLQSKNPPKTTKITHPREGRVVAYAVEQKEKLFFRYERVKKTFFYREGDVLSLFLEHESTVLEMRLEAYRLQHEERYMKDKVYRHNIDSLLLIEPLKEKLKNWGYYD